MSQTPYGTILEIEPRDGVTATVFVGAYLKSLKCYAIGVIAGPFRSGPASERLIDNAYAATPLERLRELKKEHPRWR